MARVYGNDTESASSAREALQQELEAEQQFKSKIEKGVFIGALAIAGLSLVINTGRCVSATSKASEYADQQIEAQATLDELNAQLQNPSEQNVEYEDPTVASMAEIGTAIAQMQNQMIAVKYGSGSLDSAAYENTSSDDQSDTDSSHETSNAESSGGAVTLDVTDVAPEDTSQPTESTENEIDVTESSADDVDSDYEYTPISDFNSFSDSDTSTTVSNDSSVAPITNDTRDEAILMNEFQTKYFSTAITNQEEPTSAVWSWYGYWTFNDTYDYSLQEVPTMEGIWTCYAASDTSHSRPLAIVTATYNAQKQVFTNPSIIYTQYYTKKSEAQQDTYSPSTGTDSSGSVTIDANASSSNGNTSSANDDSTSLNGQGSENNYTQTIIDDDDSDSVKISEDSSNTSNATTGSNTSQQSQQNTTQPDNPSGVAGWTPGSGATSSGTSDGTVTWSTTTGSSGVTNSSETGTWSPSN